MSVRSSSTSSTMSPASYIKVLAKKNEDFLLDKLSTWEALDPVIRARFVEQLFSFFEYIEESTASAKYSKASAVTVSLIDPTERDKTSAVALIISNLRKNIEAQGAVKGIHYDTGYPLIPSAKELLGKDIAYFTSINAKHHHLDNTLSGVKLCLMRDRGLLFRSWREVYFRDRGCVYVKHAHNVEVNEAWNTHVVELTSVGVQTVNDWINFATLCETYPRLVLAGVGYQLITRHRTALVDYIRVDKDLNATLRGDVQSIHLNITTLPVAASTTTVDPLSAIKNNNKRLRASLKVIRSKNDREAAGVDVANMQDVADADELRRVRARVPSSPRRFDAEGRPHGPPPRAPLPRVDELPVPRPGHPLRPDEDYISDESAAAAAASSASSAIGNMDLRSPLLPPGSDAGYNDDDMGPTHSEVLRYGAHLDLD